MDEITLDKIDIFTSDVEELEPSPELLSYLKLKGYKTIGRLACLDKLDFYDIYNWKTELFHELINKLSDIGITPISFYEEDGILFINSNNKYPQNLLAEINNADDLDYWVSVDKKMGVAVALSGLKEREENMLLLRYKYGFTLEKIGCFYGLSKERVRQIINETLIKLSESKRYKSLLEFGTKSASSLRIQ